MSQPQLIDQPRRIKRTRHQHKVNVSSETSINTDAVSLAAKFQLREDRREQMYGYLALIMKVGLFAVFTTSFINLSIASHHRVKRQFELSSLLKKESVKFDKLKNRFDQLFTIGGDRRFMREQDQWIAPNSVRVIWQ